MTKYVKQHSDPEYSNGLGQEFNAQSGNFIGFYCSDHGQKRTHTSWRGSGMESKVKEIIYLNHILLILTQIYSLLFYISFKCNTNLTNDTMNNLSEKLNLERCT